MLSLDSKLNIVGMACSSTATTESLANSSITQTVHHTAIKR